MKPSGRMKETVKRLVVIHGWSVFSMMKYMPNRRSAPPRVKLRISHVSSMVTPQAFDGFSAYKCG
jgi:hypothetical protein